MVGLSLELVLKTIGVLQDVGVFRGKEAVKMKSIVEPVWA